MSNRYPQGLTSDMYLIQVGIVIGYVIEGEENVPENYTQLNKFCKDKFGIEINSCEMSGMELRDLLFGELGKHMLNLLASDEEFDEDCDGTTSSSLRFNTAMDIIE